MTEVALRSFCFVELQFADTTGLEIALYAAGNHNNDYLMQYYGFCIPKLPQDTYTVDVKQPAAQGLPKEVVLSSRGPVGETAAWLKGKEPADRKAAYKVSMCAQIWVRQVLCILGWESVPRGGGRGEFCACRRYQKTPHT